MQKIIVEFILNLIIAKKLRLSIDIDYIGSITLTRRYHTGIILKTVYKCGSINTDQGTSMTRDYLSQTNFIVFIELLKTSKYRIIFILLRLPCLLPVPWSIGPNCWSIGIFTIETNAVLTEWTILVLRTSQMVTDTVVPNRPQNKCNN